MLTISTEGFGIDQLFQVRFSESITVSQSVSFADAPRAYLRQCDAAAAGTRLGLARSVAGQPLAATVRPGSSDTVW